MGGKNYFHQMSTDYDIDSYSKVDESLKRY